MFKIVVYYFDDENNSLPDYEDTLQTGLDTKDEAWSLIADAVKDCIDDIMTVPAEYHTIITPMYDHNCLRFEYGDGSYTVYCIEEDE